jgi:hypothetical protein
MSSHQRTKWTPGPWRRDLFHNGALGGRVVGRDGTPVGSVTRKADKPYDQKLADLALLSAAPELYAELERLDPTNPVLAKARGETDE